ncbi:MAG TPA: hypothetical protein PKM25_16340 [Candidatus Ozemobacteraceae bacterium]|nr:hypothetical protein [Candidatus Ozemobacteraceae bacterium]
MSDQASSLRELKRFIDHVSPEQLPGPEAFLASLPSPTAFATIALIVPDRVGTAIPPLQKWLPPLLPQRRRPTLWDQAGTLSVTTALPDTSDKTPLMLKIDSAIGPLMTLPKQISPTKLQTRPTPDQIRFLRQVQRLFAGSSEVWITIPMKDFRSHLPLIHATDAAIVLVPHAHDAVLRSYEAVKAVHLSGYFSPISLAEMPSGNDLSADQPIERIRLVAKQFLSLDLPPLGMVLSGITPSSPTNPNGQTPQKPSVVPMYDFLHAFAERILFPAPEDRQ